MSDRGTLDITAEEVEADHNAILTFESKILTAMTQMERWVEEEPKEHTMLRRRLTNAADVIMGTHPNSNYQSYLKDLPQSFQPGKSDHLATPGLSWSDQHGAEREFMFSSLTI